MTKPRINLIYYKTVLDRCVHRFFEEHTTEFHRDGNGQYVFSGMSESALRKLFFEYVKDEISGHVSDYRESSPEFNFVIGSCLPTKNIALKGVSQGARIRKIVDAAPDVRYFLLESDIKLDIRLFNSVFEWIFAKFMKKQGKTWKNVFFVRNSSLDCYFTYKLFKHRYGSMVVSIRKKDQMGDDRCIYSINETIDNICGSKLELLKSAPVVEAGKEMFQYVDCCIRGEI